MTDAGNVSATGALTINGAVKSRGNSLIFPNTLSDFKIALYSGWGFWIQFGE